MAAPATCSSSSSWSSDMAERSKPKLRGAALRCFSLARGKQREWRPRQSTRRLITLIFAGRNRMLMIRRELPRTKSACWARRAGRIERSRVLLIENASAAAGTAFPTRGKTVFMGGVGLRSDSLLLRFDFDADGPDKTQQLSTHRGDNLRFVFAARKKLSIAQMQSVLRLPGDFLDFGAKPSLTFEQVAAQPGAELIGPSGFDNHSSKMGVSGLGNAALAPSGAAGVFAGDQAAVGHQLPGRAKARNLPKLGDNGDGSDFCHTAKGLQSSDDRAHMRRRQACHFLNGAVQTLQAHGDMLDLVNIIGKRNFLSRLFEVDFGLDPLQVWFRPRGLQMCRTLPATAQQKLAQAMPSTQLVSLGCLAGAHQVAKSFVSRIGNPYRCQVSGPIAAGQFQGVTPIGFHAFARFDGYEGWSNHFAVHTQRGQLPIQHISCGSGFVASSQLLDRTKLVNQLPNRLRAVGNNPEGANFTAGFCNRDGNRFRMDIQTNEPYFIHWTDSPFACGSALRLRRVTHASRNGGRSFYFRQDTDRPGAKPVRPY